MSKWRAAAGLVMLLAGVVVGLQVPALLAGRRAGDWAPEAPPASLPQATAPAERAPADKAPGASAQPAASPRVADPTKPALASPPAPPQGQASPAPPAPIPPSAIVPPGGAPQAPPPSAMVPPSAAPPRPLPPSGAVPPYSPGRPNPYLAPPPGQGFPPPPAGPLPPPSAAPGPGPGLMPLPGAPSPGSANRVLADVAYGSEPLQRLDLYTPPGGGPAPMLLFVHGGGWSIGDKGELSWLGAKLAEQGLVVAVANYRLSPAVQHPAHVQDVARAVAWLHHNGATYGGDPARLYVGGHSAGAHLASLVALDGTYLAAEGLSGDVVRGVIGVSGAGYDLDARYAASPLAQLFFAAFGKDPARWAAAAPLRYVGKDAPPFLLVHGLNDSEAPSAGAQALAQALRRDGAQIRLELLPGLDHHTALLAALPTVRAFVQ